MTLQKNQKEIVRGAQMLNESTLVLDWDKLQPWHSGADWFTSIIAQLLGRPRWIQTTQSLIPTIFIQDFEELSKTTLKKNRSRIFVPKNGAVWKM